MGVRPGASSVVTLCRDVLLRRHEVRKRYEIGIHNAVDRGSHQRIRSGWPVVLQRTASNRHLRFSCNAGRDTYAARSSGTRRGSKAVSSRHTSLHRSASFSVLSPPALHSFSIFP